MGAQIGRDGGKGAVQLFEGLDLDHALQSTLNMAAGYKARSWQVHFEEQAGRLPPIEVEGECIEQIELTCQIDTTDQGASTGAGDASDRYPHRIQTLQHANVSPTPGAAGAQRQADAWRPAGLRVLHRHGFVLSRL
jgi:hypothetical protein